MPSVKINLKVIQKTEAWEAFKKKMDILKGEGKGVKVGVFQSAGLHDDKSEITTVEIAAIHEFGSPAAGIPERSFLRGPIRAHKKELTEISAKISKAIVNGKMSDDEGLAVLGQWGVSVCKKAIRDGDGIPPPLKPETARRKGSTRPLVDTGKLVNAITYQVIGTKEESSGGGPEGGEGGTDPAVEAGED